MLTSMCTKKKVENEYFVIMWCYYVSSVCCKWVCVRPSNHSNDYKPRLVLLLSAVNSQCALQLKSAKFGKIWKCSQKFCQIWIWHIWQKWPTCQSRAKIQYLVCNIVGVLNCCSVCVSKYCKVQSIGRARSCSGRVAAFWIEQTWRAQNCKYLPWLWTDLKTDFTNGFSVFFWS